MCALFTRMYSPSWELCTWYHCQTRETLRGDSRAVWWTMPGGSGSGGGSPGLGGMPGTGTPVDELAWGERIPQHDVTSCRQSTLQHTKLNYIYYLHPHTLQNLKGSGEQPTSTVKWDIFVGGNFCTNHLLDILSHTKK